MLALAVLALLMAVVMPRPDGHRGPLRLRADAEAVAALLRQDRNAAIGLRRPVVSRIDLAHRRVVSGSSAREVAVGQQARMTLVQAGSEQTAEGGGIRFLPDGLSTGGVLRLSAGGDSWEVSVNWLTAAVRVEEGGP